MIGNWRLGMALGLAILGSAAAANAQGVGSPDGSSSVATQSGTSTTGSVGEAATGLVGGVPTGSVGGAATAQQDNSSLSRRASPSATTRLGSSFNRLTTARRSVVFTPSRPAVGSAGSMTAAGMASRGDSLHPYSTQPRRPSSEVPAGSSLQAPRQPQRQPVMVQSTPHNYYPTMRTGQYVNANRAQVSRARTGMGMMGTGMMSCAVFRAGAVSRPVRAGAGSHEGLNPVIVLGIAEAFWGLRLQITLESPVAGANRAGVFEGLSSRASLR